MSGEVLWLAGAVVLVTNWPYTFLTIMPVNRELEAIAPEEAGPASRILLTRWGHLHLRRTMLGGLATILYLWAAIATLWTVGNL
jgi:hypothetical protein